VLHLPTIDVIRQAVLADAVKHGAVN
jgi:hypothetical protein